jgi:glycosyltransferase involved in cell wall biosynthesis
MKFLVVCYDYPRLGAPGANRWAVMTKYLRRLGHEVTVVSATSPGMSEGEIDGIVRTFELGSHTALRQALRRPPLPYPSTRRGAVNRGGHALVTRVIVPDAYLLSWNPWARRTLRRLLDTRQFDCLITTGPPESTHLLGLARTLHRMPWIAEFRDGWLFDPLREAFPTAPQRALARWLERQVVTRAEAVVGVTRPMVEDFGTRLGVSAELIHNGWDPEAVRGAGSSSDLINPRRFTFLHTGAVSGEWGRDPRPLLAALRQLIQQDAGLVERIEVLFVGTATSRDLELLGDPRLRGVVRYGGSVDRTEAFALQRDADVLLLLTSHRVSEATGKLYEYLGAGRPIVALAQKNEAARIVHETGTGVCVGLDDVEGIARQLRLAIDGHLQRAYAPRDLDRYMYPGPADRMADLAARVTSAGPAGR